MSAANTPAVLEAPKPFFLPAGKIYRDIFKFMNNYSDVFYNNTTYEALPDIVSAGPLPEEENLLFHMYDFTAKLLSVFAICDLRHDFEWVLDVEYEKKTKVSSILLSHICNGFYKVDTPNNETLFKYMVNEFKTINNHASAVSTFEEVMVTYFQNTVVSECLSKFFVSSAYAKHYLDRIVKKYHIDDMNDKLWEDTYDTDKRLDGGKPVAILVDAQTGRPASRMFLPEGINADSKPPPRVVSKTHIYIYNRTSINDAACKGSSDAHLRFHLCLDDAAGPISFSTTDMMCGSELSLSMPTKNGDILEIMNTQVILSEESDPITYGYTFSNNEKSSVNEMAGVTLRGNKGRTSANINRIIEQVSDDPLQYTAKLICKSSGDRCQTHSLRSPFLHKLVTEETPIKDACTGSIGTRKENFDDYSVFLLTNDYLAAAQAYLAQVNTIYSSVNKVEIHICYDEIAKVYTKEDIDECKTAFIKYATAKENGEGIVNVPERTVVIPDGSKYAMNYVSSLWELARSKYLGRILQFHPVYNTYSTDDRKTRTVLAMFEESGKEETAFFKRLDQHFEIEKWNDIVKKEIQLIFTAAGSLTGTVRTRAQLYMGIHSQLSHFLQSNKVFCDANAIAHHVLIATHPDIVKLFKDTDYVKLLIQKITSLENNSLLYRQLSGVTTNTIIQAIKPIMNKIHENMFTNWLKKPLDSDPSLYASFPKKFVTTHIKMFHENIELARDHHDLIKSFIDENEGIFSAIFGEIGIIVFYKQIINLGGSEIFNGLRLYTYINELGHLFGSKIQGSIKFEEGSTEYDAESNFDTLLDNLNMITKPEADLTRQEEALKAKLSDKIKSGIKAKVFKVKDKAGDILNEVLTTGKKLVNNITKKYTITTDLPLQPVASKKAVKNLTKEFIDSGKETIESTKNFIQRLGIRRQRGGFKLTRRKRNRKGGLYISPQNSKKNRRNQYIYLQRNKNLQIRPNIFLNTYRNSKEKSNRHNTRQQLKLVNSRTQMEELLHIHNRLLQFLFSLNARIMSTMNLNTLCYMSRSVLLNGMLYILKLDDVSPIEEKIQRTLVLTILLLSASSPEWEKEWNMTWGPFLSMPQTNPEIARLLPGCIYDDILFHDMPYTLAWDMIATSGEFSLEDRLDMRDTCRVLLNELRASVKPM
jgi:hypothetical protein